MICQPYLTRMESMILNIRGTGGSGKSTVIRRVMGYYEGQGWARLPQYREGRRQPIAYDVGPLTVIGHYETPCGGCDTIKTPDEVYREVRAALDRGARHVLYEGIIVQDDVTRCIQLSKEHPLTIVVLTTPVAECLAGIQARRDARGETKPLNPKNTIARARSVQTRMAKLRAAGVVVFEADRETAFQKVKELVCS